MKLTVKETVNKSINLQMGDIVIYKADGSNRAFILCREYDSDNVSFKTLGGPQPGPSTVCGIKSMDSMKEWLIRNLAEGRIDYYSCDEYELELVRRK